MCFFLVEGSGVPGPRFGIVSHDTCGDVVLEALSRHARAQRARRFVVLSRPPCKARALCLESAPSPPKASSRSPNLFSQSGHFVLARGGGL